MPCSASHFLAFPSESEEVRTSTTMNFVVRCCSRFQPWQLFSLRFAISRHLIDNDKWKTVTKLSSTTQVASNFQRNNTFEQTIKRLLLSTSSEEMSKDVKRCEKVVLTEWFTEWFTEWQSDCAEWQALSLLGESLQHSTKLVSLRLFHNHWPLGADLCQGLTRDFFLAD